MVQEKLWQNYKQKMAIIAAIAIFSVGLFLRTYHFHDWLDFGDDQVNDAIIVGNVVEHQAPWPLLGPKMSHTGNSGRQGQYHLGPMFYYFEIISAKIFGNRPDALAYPDLLFDILSLPLFYLFLKRFFGNNISLALTGLWAVSFYALSFSHSAWNPNPIPFFVLLFLISMHEFLVFKEKVSWMWVVFWGLAFGVGIQLHAILLVLLPVITLAVFFFLQKKNMGVWKKMGVVFLIALVLNAGQIVSEFQTNFSNSKVFFSSLGNNGSGSDNGTILGHVFSDISCHAQANAYILTSLGDDQCNFSFADPAHVGEISLSSWITFSLSVLFSAFGYVFLIYNFRKEKDVKRKYALGLAILFVAYAFLVFLPVVNKQFRYFLPTFFAPFLFVGFFLDYLARKNFQKFMPLLVLIFSSLLATNYISIQAAAKELLSHSRNGQYHIVLGETETMANYIIAHSKDSQAYLSTNSINANFIKPLIFVAEKNNFQILRAGSINKIIPGKSAFYLQSSELGENKISGKFVTSKNFGQVTLYQLQN